MSRASRPARYAVIGHPVTHSRSPQIHSAFAAQTGIGLVYERLEAPLNGFLATQQTFFAAGGDGLNVTVPFKREAWEAADQLSERARLAGAVNTLWMLDGQLHGCNTDGVGLVRDLQRLGRPLTDAHVLLVGAGGAARGALPALLAEGCASLRIVNRTAARALELADEFVSLAPMGTTLEAGGLPDAQREGGWDVVIQASASGIQDAAPDLPEGIYAPGAFAYDMMYGAAPTPFLRLATAQGVQGADGLGMLVEQAAESFRLWHGVQPQTDAVHQALRAMLNA